MDGSIQSTDAGKLGADKEAAMSIRVSPVRTRYVGYVVGEFGRIEGRIDLGMG